MKRLAAALVLLWVVAGLAQAQSAYGCGPLDGRVSIPAVEGDRGVFYRVHPDLRMYHPLSDGSIARLADLSDALASLGTTLIYVPVPTKALAMPDELPQAARDYGFDVTLATTLYLDALDRLQRRGVHTADVRKALRAGGDEPPSMFPADHRLTSAGARRAAWAIAAAVSAAPGFADLPKGRFESRSIGPVALPSTMRSALQQHCLIELPPVETEGFQTDQFQTGEAASGTSIFDPGMTGGRIALIGTEVDGDPAANLAGFLSEFTGLRVVQYAVAGGGGYAAMSSYLTSRAFQEARPSFLVWTNPVDNNLARFGDQPMAELIAAAGDWCGVALPTLPGGETQTLTADLSGLERGRAYTLFFDAEGSAAGSARFDFRDVSGHTRRKSVFRHPDQEPTGRFYMPMTGLWPEGALSVEIALDAAMPGTARVSACAK